MVDLDPRKLKQRLLGGTFSPLRKSWWTQRKVVSLDTLAQAFVDMGLAEDIYKGRGKIFAIENTNLDCGDSKYLRFESIGKGSQNYLVTAYRR